MIERRMQMPPLEIDGCSRERRSNATVPRVGPAQARRLRRHRARGPRLAPATNGGCSKADGAEGATSAGSPTASASRAVHAWHRQRTAGARRPTASRAGPAPARRLRRHCAQVHAWHRQRTRALEGAQGRGRDQRRLADCVGIARGPRLGPASNGGRSKAGGAEGGTSAGSPTASASRAVHAWDRHRTAGARRPTASRAGTSAGSPTASALRAGPRLARATNAGASQAEGAEGGTSAGSPTASASRAVHAWHRQRTAGARRRTAPKAGPAPARRLRRHRARSTLGTGIARRVLEGGRRRGRDQRRLADCVGIARGPRLGPASNGGRSKAGGAERGTSAGSPTASASRAVHA
jgi:hypothetical protein